MVFFFAENYYKYHYSNTCSNAFIFMVILILFAILLPFFTNVSSVDRFWHPNTVFTDHPIVQYQNEFLLQLSTSNGKTVNFYKDHLLEDDNIMLSSINIETQDYSNKDIINIIKFKGHIDIENNPTSEEIDNNYNEIKFFIFFDYYMIEDANFHIRSKSHIFYSLSSSNERITKFKANGDLILKQNKGLIETYFMKNEGSNLKFNEEINEVLNDPFSRDENYYFEIRKNNIYVEKGENNDNGIDFEITVNIPYYQDIIVQLPHYTNLKNKWVLYSMLFFPTLFVCYWLMELVIDNQIFKTRIKSDIPIKL